MLVGQFGPMVLQDTLGNLAASKTVTVTTQAGTPATLYTDPSGLTTTGGNTFTTTADGLGSFYAAPGIGYVISFTVTTSQVMPVSVAYPIPTTRLWGPFNIHYNTPNVATGVTLYTPQVNEVLLDVIIQLVTHWDTATVWSVGTDSTGSNWTEVMNNETNTLLNSAGSVDNVDHGLSLPGAGATTAPLSMSQLAVVNTIAAVTASAPINTRASAIVTTATPLKFALANNSGSTQGELNVFVISALFQPPPS